MLLLGGDWTWEDINSLSKEFSPVPSERVSGQS